jgi:hypothetical protein
MNLDVFLLQAASALYLCHKYILYLYLLDKLNARKAGVVRGLRPRACPPPPLRRRVDDMTAADLCCNA